MMARDNGKAFAELQAMIDKIKAVGALPAKVAPQIAELTRQKIADNIANGVDPGGKPWPLTKDGKRPLRNAAKALRARAIGTVVQLVLEGPEARHHLGIARGHVRRQILPSGALPQPLVTAIRDVLITAAKKTVA